MLEYVVAVKLLELLLEELDLEELLETDVLLVLLVLLVLVAVLAGCSTCACAAPCG